MKTVYLIGGTMGVGKTTVCQRLKQELPRCVFLDGDWCWDASPFQVTEETKAMVQNNIRYLLGSFLSCSAYENVVFCWVMHEQGILDALLSGLPRENVQYKCISLTADESSLRERLNRDVAAGLRTADVIERSLARLPLYEKLSTVKIDTSAKSVPQVVAEIMGL